MSGLAGSAVILLPPGSSTSRLRTLASNGVSYSLKPACMARRCSFTPSFMASRAWRSPRLRITQRRRWPWLSARRQSSTISSVLVKVLPHWRANMAILNLDSSCTQRRW